MRPIENPPVANRQRRSGLRWCFWAPALLAAAGCGGVEELATPDYELLSFREQLAEIPLGAYSVPVPIAFEAEGGLGRDNRLQFRFELFALVSPRDRAKAIACLARQKGQLRDTVISVCRNSTVDDLLDPQLSNLRSRLLDAIQPLLENVTPKRILVTRRMTEPL